MYEDVLTLALGRRTYTPLMKEARAYIGTSGWMYKDWGETFYPPELKKGHLSFLSQEFDTVEVNTTFYHLQPKSTFKKWHDETREGFMFAVKLSRYITHHEKLVSVKEPLERFMSAIVGLEEKRGPILIQLPPWLKFDEAVLERFLADLRKICDRKNIVPLFALEPRHKSWMEHAEIVRPLLKEQNIAIVFPHSSKIPSFEPVPENITADFVYVRFHGPSEFAASRYGPRRLRPWADRMLEWQRKKLTVFAYFNNDVHGHAIHDARTLIRQIGNSN